MINKYVIISKNKRASMRKFVLFPLFFAFLLVSCQDPSNKANSSFQTSVKIEKAEKKEIRSRRW
jgi:hypothetical protein